MSANRGGDNRGRGRGRDPPIGGGSPSTHQPSASRGRFRRGGRGRGGGSDVVFGGPAASADQRLATSTELVKSLKSTPYDCVRPTRPGFGTLGRPGVLRANFFPVKFPKTGIIYDHHIEITPKTDLKSIRTRLFALLEQSAHPGWQEYVPFIAHDGSARLVSSKRLPQPLDIPILFLQEGQAQPSQHDRTYTFSITLTQELNSSDLDSFIHGDPNFRYHDPSPIISAHNLVLQYHASHNGVRVRKNAYFFPPRRRAMELSIGVDAWRGFFMPARPVYKELMINVGICMSAFYKAGNLARALMEFQERSAGAIPWRFAQRLRVTISYLGYRQTKVVQRITSTTARTTSFQCDEFNATMTIEQYFMQKHHITLTYPDLPVIKLFGPNANHSTYVPPELCEILPGQPFRGNLDDEQTDLMLRHARKRPVDNARAILNDGVPMLGLRRNNQKLTNFGISVSRNMAGIPFRELPPPGVSYRDSKPVNVNNGSWNILDVKFHLGGVVKSWWILVVTEQRPIFNGHDDPQLTALWKGFAGKCQRSGMTGISPDSAPTLLNVALVDPTNDPDRQESLGRIRSTIRDNQAQHGTPSFVLVLLSKRDSYIYPGIKRICDVELGIHTIHMLSNKVLTDPRRQDQYFSNVALKVNTKLGGINHKIDDWSLQWLTKTKTMLVGMDVTHPGPGSIEGTPSIAAVVASVDGNFAQFPASMRCQETKKEMITELTAMMIERLKRYQEVNKSLPERVYVFRCGVSNAQFDIVLQAELPQITDAFKRVNPRGGSGKPYRPQLTIVICGKANHARMWPPDASADKDGNPRPGTVVDQGITAIFDFDFYLQTHAALNGHAKPKRYTVLYDESRLGADEIQQGINTTSYLYARATKAVSFMPPTYYAELACKRGRCYLNDFFSGTGTTDEEEERAQVFGAARRAWGNGIHPNLAGSMFYI
ncbi:argonaute-like protein [Butyriboletus roseoflavus]|nr:argonaute-like protein [Butyriboletus roseoflavus]